jgi:hypothetical protein
MHSYFKLVYLWEQFPSSLILWDVLWHAVCLFHLFIKGIVLTGNHLSGINQVCFIIILNPLADCYFRELVETNFIS